MILAGLIIVDFVISVVLTAAIVAALGQLVDHLLGMRRLM